MIVPRKVTDLAHGDSVIGLGTIYHVWIRHYKIQVAVRNKRPRSFHIDEKVLVDVGYMGSLGPLPMIESEMAFNDKRKLIWKEAK